jgi:hypothetical protein
MAGDRGVTSQTLVRPGIHRSLGWWLGSGAPCGPSQSGPGDHGSIGLSARIVTTTTPRLPLPTTTTDRPRTTARTPTTRSGRTPTLLEVTCGNARPSARGMAMVAAMRRNRYFVRQPKTRTWVHCWTSGALRYEPLIVQATFIRKVMEQLRGLADQQVPVTVAPRAISLAPRQRVSRLVPSYRAESLAGFLVARVQPTISPPSCLQPRT